MKKYKVLIADDVDIMRRMLKTALATYECEIVGEVADGSQVVSRIAAFRPDVVFLDINMPGQNGLDVLQELRQHDAKTFVVILSGHNNFENVQKAIERGADAFVVKPFSVVKIKEVLDRCGAKQAGR